MLPIGQIDGKNANMTLKFLLAGTAVLGALTLGATASHATVFGGSASFSADPAFVNFTAAFPNSNGAFATNDLTAGGSQTFNAFVTITGGLATVGTTSTGISLDLAFNSPDSTGVDNQAGTGTMTYAGFVSPSTGSVAWTGSNGTYAAQDVTFADGAEAEVDIYDTVLAQNPGISGQVIGDVEVVIKDLADPTAVPEPGALSLLASGLFGLGFITRRFRGGNRA